MLMGRAGTIVAGGVVTLSGESGINDSDTSSPFDARAGIRIRQDGTIDKYKLNAPGAGYTQLDSATDWIIPNTAASTDYQVKLDVTSGTPAGGLSDSTGTWLAMTSDREWIAQATGNPQNITINWTLRIRKGTGAEIDNGVYTGSVSSGL
jgi:hypothetical protein